MMGRGRPAEGLRPGTGLAQAQAAFVSVPWREHRRGSENGSAGTVKAQRGEGEAALAAEEAEGNGWSSSRQKMEPGLLLCSGHRAGNSGEARRWLQQSARAGHGASGGAEGTVLARGRGQGQAGVGPRGAGRTEGHQHSTWGGTAAARGHAVRGAPGETCGGRSGAGGGCGGKWPGSPSTQRYIMSFCRKKTKPNQPPSKQTNKNTFFFLFPFGHSLLFIVPTVWLQIFHCTMNIPAFGQSACVVIFIFPPPFWDRKPN